MRDEIVAKPFAQCNTFADVLFKPAALTPAL